MDGHVITPNLFIFFMVPIHPNLQRNFFLFFLQMDVHPKSQMLTPGQVLRSYILKPLRKDLTSIMSFILSLLVFGGQNVHECVQTLIPNLCMTFKRWQDYEWRPETRFWRSEARQPPNMFLMDLHPRCSVHAKFGVIPSMGGHFRASVTYKKRLCCPPFFVFNPILAGWLPL